MTDQNQEDHAEEQEGLSVELCVEFAKKFASVCDGGLLAELPFEVGLSDPPRAKRARELASLLSPSSS